MERLEAGETILCAEGYLLALCRMGYLTHGLWIPEFILEQPEVLKTVHYEFVHAGTDVTEAFQVRSIIVVLCVRVCEGGAIPDHHLGTVIQVLST